MRILRRSDAPTTADGPPVAAGPVRLSRTGPQREDPARATRELAARLQPGEIAVIDHLDLDRVTAELLVRARPAAVVDVRPVLSGRHPAQGAAVLLAARVPLLDDAGPSLLSELRDGQQIRLEGGDLIDGERVVGRGTARTTEDVARAEEAARSGAMDRLAGVGADMAGYVRAQGQLLLEGAGLPDLTTDLSARPVLVVAPGERAAEDVRALRGWLRETRPVLVGAEGGAAILATAGLTPDLVVGDAGALRRRRHGALEHVPGDPSLGSATDQALLLAAHARAPVVVLAGAPASLDVLLDGSRPAAASALAVRLRLGDRLTDAQAVARLHRPAVSALAVALLLVAGVAALAVAVLLTPGGRQLAEDLGAWWPW